MYNLTKPTNSLPSPVKELSTILEKVQISANLNNENVANSGVFDLFPTEIYFPIFDYLAPRDLLNMRLVNKRLNKIVETYKPLWQEVEILVLPRDKNGELAMVRDAHLQTVKNEKIFEFLNRLPVIENVQLMCDVEVGTNAKSTSVIESSNGRINTRHFELFYLNTKLMMAYFKQIANSCNRLTICSFYQPPKSLALPSNHGEIVEMKHVKCLNITCEIQNFSVNFDPNKGEEPYSKKNVFVNNILFNNLETIFPNLTHLHLHGYVESIQLLFEKLSQLKNSLKLVEIKFSVDIYEIFGPKKYKINKKKAQKPLDAQNRLKLESLCLRDNEMAEVVSILKNYIDLNCVENLSLIGHLGQDDAEYYDLVDLFDLVVMKMPNLKNFTTDLTAAPKYLYSDRSRALIKTMLAQTLFPKLDKICLAYKDDMLFAPFCAYGKCACPRSDPTSNRIDNDDIPAYPFGLSKVKWLFDENIQLRARTIILDLTMHCFCDKEQVKGVVKEVVERLVGKGKWKNERLENVEIRFLRKSKMNKVEHSSACIDVDMLKFFRGFEYLKQFKRCEIGPCSLEIFF